MVRNIKEERYITMKRTKQLLVCIALAVAMAVTMLPNLAYGEESIYPLEPVTLTINMDVVDRETIPDWALDYYIWDIVEEKTGVTLERKGASGQGSGNTEDISLMIASGQYPDIFLNNWLSYPGGAAKAIQQNIIIKLNDVFDQYAPNLTKVLDENEKWAKDIATDDGTYYVFPLLRAERDQCFYGIGYRQDKLDEFGLEVPTTPEELENVLTVFKDNGMECGMTFEYRFLFTGDQGYGTDLQSGFGLKSGWYVDDGVVHFGEYEENYYDFLVWMNRLYTNELIDPDMPSIDKATSLAKFSNGNTWACICMSSLAVAELEYLHEGWEGVGGPALAMAVGEEPQFGQLQNSYAGNASAAISSTCSNVEAAARFLDWFYGEENLEIFQHGVEGFAYAIVDGEYTRDLQYLIPLEGEGADNVSTRMTYAQIGTNFPMKMLDGMSHDYHQYPEKQAEILATWRANNMAEHIMPPVTFTTDEAGEYSSLYTEIDTYMKEQIAKFIIGTRPLEEYDDFRNTLETLGIERMIELQQAAYDRYLER